MLHDLNRRRQVITRNFVNGAGVTVVPQAFSVAVVHVNDLRDLQAAANAATPIATAATSTDCQSGFAADPFLTRVGDEWFVFYEVWNMVAHKGEIAYSSSRDLINWTYGGRCLIEPFHLSYPSIFQYKGVVYMIPEAAQAGMTLMYRAERFPDKWVVDRILLEEPLLDGSLFEHDSRWWCSGMGYWKNVAQLLDLRVFSAANPLDSWTRHPASPVVVGNPRASRPAGRTVSIDGRLIRFAQAIVPAYGTAVHAYEITQLSAGEYQERPFTDEPFLAASGSGWNEHGMHHVDIVKHPDGGFVCAVDGWHWTASSSDASVG